MKKTAQFKKVEYIDGVMVYLFAIVANLVMQLVVISTASVVLSIATRNENIAQSDYFNLVSMYFLQAAFFVVPVIYFVCKKKAKPLLASPYRKGEPSLAFSVILPVLSMIGFILPAYLFELGLIKVGYNPSAGVNMNTPGKLVLGVIVMVIIAPLVEELIFRGFLLSGLRERFNPYVAALLSAIAFSLMHMNPEQTVYQFCLGYACGLAAIKSGNLWSAVIVHAGSNLLALFAGGLLDKGANWVIGLNPAFAVLITLAAALVCGALIFFTCVLMGRLTKRKDPPAELVAAESREPFEELAEAEEEPSAAPPPPVAPAITRNNKFVGRTLYFAGLGMCLFMWVLVFVLSML